MSNVMSDAEQDDAAQRRAAYSETVEDMVAVCDKAWESFKRSLAGYQTMVGAYNTLLGSTPPGSRRRGLPVLEFGATADGVTVLSAALDFSRMKLAFGPQATADAVVPLAKFLRHEMHSYLLEMGDAVARIGAVVAPSEGQPESQPPQPSPGGPAAGGAS